MAFMGGCRAYCADQDGRADGGSDEETHGRFLRRLNGIAIH
jgi:hypothetical protein